MDGGRVKGFGFAGRYSVRGSEARAKEKKALRRAPVSGTVRRILEGEIGDEILWVEDGGDVWRLDRVTFVVLRVVARDQVGQSD